HHDAADIDISVVNAEILENLSGHDGQQPAAINLAELIPRGSAGSAVAGGEVLGIEAGDRAITEAEDEPEPDDFRDRRQNDVMRVEQVEIGNHEHQEDDGRG